MTSGTCRICSRGTTSLSSFLVDLLLSFVWEVECRIDSRFKRVWAYPSLFSFFFCFGKPCLSQLARLFQECFLSLCQEQGDRAFDEFLNARVGSVHGKIEHTF